MRYPTPMATEVRQGYQNRHRGKKGVQKSLTTVIKEMHYPTPIAHDYLPATKTIQRKDGKTRLDQLATFVVEMGK